MSYRLVVKPSAEKQLGGLPRSVQRRIVAKVAEIENTPRLTGAIKLVGSERTYRVRVGNYRIVYEVDEGAQTVFVTIIAHRRDVYRGM